MDGRDKPSHDGVECSRNKAMMGSRGYKGGDECDAFSRLSRRILSWKRGELRGIRRRFWKRTRKNIRNEISRAGIAAIAREPEGM